jgi:5-methylcytosine-specific restriction protein A
MVDNAIALCPNCHREAHFGPERRELQSQLKRAIALRDLD